MTWEDAQYIVFQKEKTNKEKSDHFFFFFFFFFSIPVMFECTRDVFRGGPFTRLLLSPFPNILWTKIYLNVKKKKC